MTILEIRMRTRLSDVNKIPKKEAIKYLKRNIPRDSNETEITRSLIKLIEQGLVGAIYQNGHIAYQANKDVFKVFVTTWSNNSEQEIKTMLPKWRKITEEYKDQRKALFKKGMLSEPLIEALKSVSNLNACDIKSIQLYISEKHHKNKYLNIELTSKTLEYFSMLSESETRTSNTKINEVIMDIKKLVDEEERKILEYERRANQFIELFERFSNQSVSEVKRILSETRKRLEEKVN